MNRPYISRAVRLEVERRAGGLCEYCLCPLNYSMDPYSVEHIYPLSLNGLSTLDNLAFSCQGCNNNKGSRISGIDIVTGEEHSLYNPRIHSWEDHFGWDEDFTIISVKSPIGRVSLEILDLNRFGVVNLRRLLREYGKHPTDS